MDRPCESLPRDKDSRREACDRHKSKVPLELLSLSHQLHRPRIQIGLVILKMTIFVRRAGQNSVPQVMLLFLGSEWHDGEVEI